MVQRRTTIMLLIIIVLIAFPFIFESKAVSAPSSDDEDQHGYCLQVMFHGLSYMDTT